VPTIKNTIIEIIQVAPDQQLGFNEWQSALNNKIAKHPGFVSLEFTAPQGAQTHWSIIQRFNDEKSSLAWQNSLEYQQLQTRCDLFPERLADDNQPPHHHSGDAYPMRTLFLGNPPPLGPSNNLAPSFNAEDAESQRRRENHLKNLSFPPPFPQPLLRLCVKKINLHP